MYKTRLMFRLRLVPIEFADVFATDLRKCSTIRTSIYAYIVLRSAVAGFSETIITLKKGICSQQKYTVQREMIENSMKSIIVS